MQWAMPVLVYPLSFQMLGTCHGCLMLMCFPACRLIGSDAAACQRTAATRTATPIEQCHHCRRLDPAPQQICPGEHRSWYR